MMTLQQALEHLVAKRDLSRDAMREVMTAVMTGEASNAQIGALLVALRMKGEAIDEIAGAAEVMRELVTPVNVSSDDVIDLVGTGGDGANLFNVSTAATFVAAAAGARVAKHGNRSVSSSSGSSDVLEALGVSLTLTPDQIAQCLETIGVGFMFAPSHHSAMTHAIGPRRELGMRTLFNVLGPLTNPALVRRQVLGVYDPALCEPLAKALQQVELLVEPAPMAFLVQCDGLEQHPAADIVGRACLGGSGRIDLDRLRLIGAVDLEHLFQGLCPHRCLGRHHLGITAKEQDAVDEQARMAKLFLHFLAHRGGQFAKPPSVQNMGMQEVLLRCGQFHRQGFLQGGKAGGVAGHMTVLSSVFSI